MKIETLVKQQVNDLKTQQRSSTSCLTKAKSPSLMTYGNTATFLQTFNPSMQHRYCKDVDRCFFGTAPTLSEVCKRYGDNADVAWLIPQLTNLSEYCGLKDKASTMQLQECAKTISSIYYFLKVTELMYFFLRFKSGSYGRFYSFFDPQFITAALRDFCKERETRYTLRESQLRIERAKAETKDAISYEEYLKRKKAIAQ